MYNDLLEDAKKQYDAMYEEYCKVVDNPNYMATLYSAPFTFLKALYLAKRICFYEEAEPGKKPRFEFSSIQEGVSTYKDIINYKKNIMELLNSASVICTAQDLANKINSFVALSDYLDDSFLVQSNEKIAKIARDCLKELPVTSRYIKPELRFHLLCDMMDQFDANTINALADKGVFRLEDIDELVKIAVTDNEKKNIEELCKHLGLSVTPILSTKVRLKGVSFNNDDGSSRQVNLKLLKEHIDTTKSKPALSVVPYTYYPPVGSPEPATKVLWGDKELGCLARDISIQMANEYADKVLTASVSEIVGGDNVSYGLEINLDICEPVRIHENDERELQQ